MDLDELDRQLLSVLVRDGRVRWSALAEQLGVSPPAIADRVRRLEKGGVITGYTAKLNAEQLGLALSAFVMVTLDHPRYRQGFLNYIQSHSAIEACHHVIGEGDYLLQVRCRSTAELEGILSDEIKALPGIQQTRTTISLSTVKASTALPVAVSPVDIEEGCKD
ncbi:MAG: Lrp/AsnC family transcriptional regulator [Cyanobacteria bacterium J06598_3]